MLLNKKIRFAVITCSICLVFLFLSSWKSGKEWELYSPDANLRVHVFQSSNKELYYNVTVLNNNGSPKTIIKDSRLGLIREDQDFVRDLKMVEFKTSINNKDEYRLISGKRSQCENVYNQTVFFFKNKRGSLLKIVFRIHNDGIAFRYIFPETDIQTKIVTKEITEFVIPTEGRAWMHPYADASKWGPAYERNFENAIPIGTTCRDSVGWAFPLLFNTNSHWLLISEADVNETFCGSHLQPEARDGIYKIRFPESNEANDVGVVSPQWTLPWAMPWRFIVISKSVGGIVESTRATDLSEPSKISDSSWIKPGKAAWSWISERASTRDFNKQIAYVDFAKQMNWQYSLLDGGWQDMKGGTIEQLIEHANSKGIGLLVWYNSGASHNPNTENSRNLLFIKENRIKEFKRLQKLGIKGVKIDFFHSDKQWMMNYYLDILSDAADHKLMVDFHGCTLPRGWSRTWPNLMSMEAVRGVECYTWDPRFPAEAALYNNILAYTRNVVGPMDYTPVTFGSMPFPPVTSYAHELALSVIFESGIQHMGDSKDSYLSMPPKVIDFLREVPNAWDDTRWVAGTPDTYLVLARRKGEVWYVAGIHSGLKKEIELSLPFIEKGKKMSIIADGLDAKSFSYQQIEFNGDPIKIQLQINGGFVCKIK